MRCLIDARLPPALARWLTTEGHDPSHVSDVGLAQATDAAIWQHAAGTRKAELLQKLTAVWPEVADAITRGESLIELA